MQGCHLTTPCNPIKMRFKAEPLAAAKGALIETGAWLTDEALSPVLSFRCVSERSILGNALRSTVQTQPPDEFTL